MEIKAGTQSMTQDPWDAALFGGASASMYKSTPAVQKNQTPPVQVAPPPAISDEVTSLFKQSAGIPRDIAPQQPVPQLTPKPVPPATPPVLGPSVEISIPIKTRPAGIPQLKAEDELVISPLSPLAMLLEVPKAPAKATPLKLKSIETPKALPPAYPVASFASHLLVVLVGIPLFAAGFYLADYTKNHFEVKNSTTAQAAVVAAATSTNPR